MLTERQIVPSVTVEALDFGAVRRFLSAQGLDLETPLQPAREDDLRNASIAEDLDGVLRPTLYGLFVFGKEPQAGPHTGSLFIQCAAYDGRDQAAEVLSAAESKGNLEDQVSRAAGWFRSLGRREIHDGLYRKDIPPMPSEALREALVNAVIHRDYAITGSQVLLEVFSDRVVVTSPGALPNHMTVEQARSGGAPRSRNEMMANAMVVLGLMGAPRTRLASDAAGHAPFQRDGAGTGERQPKPFRPCRIRSDAPPVRLGGGAAPGFRLMPGCEEPRNPGHREGESTPGRRRLLPGGGGGRRDLRRDSAIDFAGRGRAAAPAPHPRRPGDG